MSTLKRLLPTQDNAERRLILSEVLGEPISIRMMKLKIQQLHKQREALPPTSPSHSHSHSKINQSKNHD